MKLIQSESQYHSALIVMVCIVLSMLIVILSFIGRADAGEFKTGVVYLDTKCKPIDNGIGIIGSYEERYGHGGAELGLLAYRVYVNDCGELYAFNPYITGKVYIGNAYISSGIGYSLNLMDTQFDVDSEWERHIGLGVDFNKDYTLSIERRFEDLDLETGYDYEPPGGIEKHSRLDSWMIAITKRW